MGTVRTGGTQLEVLGREAERTALRDALAAALDGRGALVTVLGEPGIGKTTLLDDLAASAAEHEGAAVAWGRCWEAGGAPAYWPWRQVVQRLAERVDDVQAPEALLDRLDGGRVGLPSDPERAAFAVLEALASYLAAAALHRPLVVLLEDLHVADPASLRALDYVTDALRTMPVLVVASAQDAPLLERADVAAVAGAVLRRSRRLDLEGLPREATAALLAREAGAPVPGHVARAVHTRGAGNPFFAAEMARTLGDRLLDAAAVAEVPLPEGVRQAVLPRLHALPGDLREVLEVAAVIGRDFRLITLEHATGLDRPALLDLLDEAAARTLVRPSGGRPGVLRFVHGLLREGLYDGLSTRRRAELHGRVAAALEALAPETLPDAQLTELAHHAVLASPLDGAERAVRYSEQAARRAVAGGAHDEAVRHWQAALGALELLPPEPPHEARLLLALGRAQHAAGHPEAPATLEAAADAAKALGDHLLLAEVALAFGPYGLSPGVVDPVWLRLVDDALAAAPADDVATRARLRARRSRVLYYAAGTRTSEDALAALEDARGLGDPALLAALLSDVQFDLWRPDTIDQCLEACEEQRVLVGAIGDPAAEAPVLLRETSLRLELGDVAGSHGVLEQAAELVGRHPDLRGRAVVRVQQARRATLEGRFADVPALHDEALALAQWLKDSPIPVMVLGQKIALSRLVGGSEALEEIARGAAAALPGMPVMRAALASILLDLGRHDEAREEAERLVAGDLRGVHRNDAWLTVVALCGEVAARTGSPQAAALRQALAPYAGRLVNTVGGSYLGQVDRVLGLLAAAAGEHDAALEHLRSAQQRASRIGAVPDRLRALVEEVAVRRARGEATGAPEAEAEEGLTRLGMATVRARLEVVRATGPDAGAPASAAAAARATAAGEGTLHREGDVWTLGLDGHVVRLKDARGVGHLATLLEHPGREVAALELEGGGAARDARAGEAGAAQGDLGEVLDAEAREAFRTRVADLREELEVAERHHDPERAARAREELEALTDALAAATGLGGRARRAGSPAERARVNVTRALKGVLKKIAEHDAALGAELSATVRTGTYCAYEPDPRRPVRWDVRR